jgi:hypothetical protein
MDMLLMLSAIGSSYIFSHYCYGLFFALFTWALMLIQEYLPTLSDEGNGYTPA